MGLNTAAPKVRLNAILDNNLFSTRGINVYSEIVDGKVLDYKFKSLGHNNGQNFYVGHIYVGQVFRIGRTWTAVTNQGHPLFPVNGFATRMDAVQLLLVVFRQRDDK